MRREGAKGVMFVTILRFGSLEDVEAFAGKRYQQAMVTDGAQELLLRHSNFSYHYEVKAELLG